MNIQGIRQTVAETTGQILPARENKSVATTETSDTNIGIDINKQSSQKRIDMRNISPNDYNELVRSGITDLPVPMVQPGGRLHLDGQQADMADIKTDYIDQIEQSIASKTRIGDLNGVDFLKERLDKVKALHGQEFTPIDGAEGIHLTV